MNNLDEKLLNYLDEHDVKIVGEFGEYEKSIELEFYSVAGEDYVFTIPYSDNKSFVEEFKAHAEYFDVDEHAELWIDSRGKNGCPATITELLEDSRDIKKTLEDLADGLNEILEEIEEERDEELDI